MQIPYLRHLREIAEAQEVGCPFWLSFITVISQANTSLVAKSYENFTYAAITPSRIYGTTYDELQ